MYAAQGNTFTYVYVAYFKYIQTAVNISVSQRVADDFYSVW